MDAPRQMRVLERYRLEPIWQVVFAPARRVGRLKPEPAAVYGLREAAVYAREAGYDLVVPHTELDAMIAADDEATM